MTRFSYSHRNSPFEFSIISQSVSQNFVQVAGLEHQKQSLENIMSNEKQHAGEHIQFLEKKFRDVQDVLVQKMRELSASRDAQIPLKAEIEALKAMLEQEERR